MLVDENTDSVMLSLSLSKVKGFARCIRNKVQRLPNQGYIGFCLFIVRIQTGFLHTSDSTLNIYIERNMTEIDGYTSNTQLWQMFFAVIFFHVSEFILAIAFHGRKITPKSLLISRSYLFAMILSLLEYFVERNFFPTSKEHWFISNFGLTMVIVGETIRKLAIITAGHAFTHLIKIQRDEEHKLITHGVYKFVRHPGYSGFFIWSVGMQIMLCNPICTIAFTVVVWRFFSSRIPYEEFYLRHFFGSQYDDYASRVSSGIPFVK